MNSVELQQLKEDGFVGFVPVATLLRNGNGIPGQKGVYVILRPSDANPEFLAKGTGGFFKGKNPNVSLAELENNWVENTSIMYIGQTDSSLSKRIKTYLRFGEGAPVGHWGGRLIWQLKDARDLLVCWKTGIDFPRSVEKSMIQAFKFEHGGQRPFANLTD